MDKRESTDADSESENVTVRLSRIVLQAGAPRDMTASEPVFRFFIEPFFTQLIVFSLSREMRTSH
jgi:hypothetical protein